MSPTHSRPTFLLTRLLLGSALALSLAAVASMALQPRVRVNAGGVVSSTGSAVKVDARSSHAAVGPTGTEFFTEYSVTLPAEAGVAPARVSMAVVLDRSGSMSGNKLEDARRAVHRLIDLLAEGDELALVTFGSDVDGGELRRIDAQGRALLHAQVNAVQAAGGTNVSSGLVAGQRALSASTGARRLVLISDGQPTEGVTDALVLANVVGSVHDDAVTVTALGVGTDYDGALLTLLSERGGGMLGHLENAAMLEEVLGKELAAARTAVARNVELRLSLRGARLLDAPGRNVFWREGAPVLSLADLRPGVPTRVVVRLVSEAQSFEESADVLAEVTWRALRGESQRSTVPLEVAVLDDLARVTASRDEAVFGRGVSAVGAVRMLAAASAFERGDDRLGSSLLDEARGIFGMSADALAGQGDVETLRTKVKGAGQLERKRLSYGLEKKTLQNFGRENEGY